MTTQATTRPFSSLALLAAVLSLAGCAAMDKMAADQQAYNIQHCQAFGLTPGSDAYVQCVSQGANAYAAARANANAAAAANPAVPGMAVVPIGIGIPVVVPVAPPAKNNTCSAPKSAGKGSCQGCSVSCGAQTASCTPGQEFPGGSDICMQSASCTCQ
jgi:hypothetical protein